ncbi:hypothetical protein Fmac_025325 [Flemingia macrophylla]|uniref:Uncharacterized protein n=1 Tax=Flemingia macrophylla TaxID=520843 RepID=A0ABD1LRX0_9FABA
MADSAKAAIESELMRGKKGLKLKKRRPESVREILEVLYSVFLTWNVCQDLLSGSPLIDSSKRQNDYNLSNNGNAHLNSKKVLATRIVLVGVRDGLWCLLTCNVSKLVISSSILRKHHNQSNQTNLDNKSSKQKLLGLFSRVD